MKKYIPLCCAAGIIFILGITGCKSAEPAEPAETVITKSEPAVPPDPVPIEEPEPDRTEIEGTTERINIYDSFQMEEDSADNTDTDDAASLGDGTAGRDNITGSSEQGAGKNNDEKNKGSKNDQTDSDSKKRTAAETEGPSIFDTGDDEEESTSVDKETEPEISTKEVRIFDSSAISSDESEADNKDADADAASSQPLVENEKPGTEQEMTVKKPDSEKKRRTFSDYGYFFTAPQIGPFSVIEAEFKKNGGYEKSAFGFVFSYTADAEGWLSDYMRFEINTAGQFGVYTYDGKIYTDLVEEQEPNTAYLYSTPEVQKGYDTANKLRITDNGDGTCTIAINGIDMVTVKLVHGKIGKVMPFFSVGKADQEKLPTEPVVVTYRITEAER